MTIRLLVKGKGCFLQLFKKLLNSQLFNGIIFLTFLFTLLFISLQRAQVRIRGVVISIPDSVKEVIKSINAWGVTNLKNTE